MYAVFCSDESGMQGTFIGLTENLTTLEAYLKGDALYDRVALQWISRRNTAHHVEATLWYRLCTKYALELARQHGEYKIGDLFECEPEYYLLVEAKTL